MAHIARRIRSADGHHIVLGQVLVLIIWMGGYTRRLAGEDFSPLRQWVKPRKVLLIGDLQERTVTAIFAKCKGTAQSYRVTESAVGLKTVKAKRPASLSHTFNLEEGEFIKVFFWDSEAAQQVKIRHITFDNEGLKQ